MGVAGLYQRLKKKGLCPPSVHPSSLPGKTFHIDFLGCYFASLLQQLRTDSSIENGHRVGGTLIQETFGHQCIVHCDGEPTKEKEKAHQERQDKRNKAKIKLEKSLNKMEERSRAGKWTSKAVVKTIEQCLKRMFVVPSATMHAVTNGLATVVTVCHCMFEADMCIANLAPNDPEAVAVSGDSDLLGFEGIRTVLRPLPQNKGYGVYSKEATLKALELPSEAHLAILTTVSENDFSTNVKQLGLARNTEIIAKIPLASPDTMLERYVEIAATRTSEDVSLDQFKNARHVFLDRCVTSTEAHKAHEDLNYKNGMQELQRLKNLRLAMKDQRARSLTISPPFYVARRSTPNPFRPVFKNKKSILAGRKCKDVITCKQHEHQLPPRIPGPRPRPPATKKPIVKKARKGKKKTKPSEKKRQLRSAVVDDHQLRSKFQTKTITIGSVTGRMVDMGLDRHQAETLRTQLQAAVFLLNDIQLRAYYATAIYITHLLDSTQSNSLERMALLNQTIDDAGFMYNLGRMLYHGGASGKGRYTALSTSNARSAAASAQVAYDLFSDMTSLRPLKDDVPDLPITAMSDMAMISVQAALRSHYRNCVFEGHPNPDPDNMSDIDHFFNMNVSGQYCDFPKAKLATGFVVLPEAALLDIFYARDETKKIVQEMLCELARKDGTMNKKKTTEFETFRFKNAAVDYVRNHIGRFMERLFGCAGYASASVQEDVSETRYKLKGSVVTNGLEIHLLAYDTKSPRRRTTSNAEPEENQDQDLANEMDAELEIEGGFTAVEDLDADTKAMLQAQIASGTATIVTQSTPAASEAESSSQTAPARFAVNWRQKSKLLANLEVVLDKPEDRARLTDAIILGVDPGEINPLVITKLDPRQPNERNVVKITRKMQYIPYARYRQALETRKADANIDKAESGIPTFSRATLSRSSWMLKKSWDLKKAQRSLIDLSVKAILRLAGGSEGRKREEGERKVVICIGLASFNSQTGLASKHSRLERQLVLKAGDL
ncbi:hypothetical protein EC968_009627 [Mortierella alpina]|nr:hypothetical protein EC968_009627 [Mortierella alpina]